jgi:hypothetical protein
MIGKLCLCLAMASAQAVAAKPKPKAVPAAPAARGNADVPLAGSAAELLDPATGRGRAVGPLPETLTDFQATAFPQGRVLITGGSVVGRATQWFDPATRLFTPGPPMTQPRQGHRALLLKDGRLLLVGGTEARTPAELLEPGADRFQSLSAEATFALSAEAVELDGGKVFLVDGSSGQCFTWDGRKRFSAQGSLNRPRNFFRVTRLRDGRVLITGGWPSEQKLEPKLKGRGPRLTPSTATPVLPVECFNPRWSTLSSWKALPAVRARHQATLLADGRVCLWAGYGQDATSACEAVELLDPVKETLALAGKLPLDGFAQPAWTEGLFLAEHSVDVRAAAAPPALLDAAGPAKLRLANAFLTPTLVPLGDGKVLALGAPAWGDPMDRWDPRTRQCTLVGSLRAGTRNLGLTPDGKLLALGGVIDQVEPRTGVLKPLGWREDLEALLKTVKPYQPSPSPLPPWPQGQARKDCLVVALDKTHALVAGGTPEGSDEPSARMDLWDLKKKTLTPVGAMKTRRAFPAGSPQGALKLADGSVVLWGPGKD